MCGIAGVAMRDAPVDAALIGKITESLHHRGPDDSDVIVHGKVGLGHRRLSVIDTSSAGRQPMGTEDDRYWITYNGETYNFADLRTDLEKRGEHFHSRTDSEVILRAFRHYGRETWSRLTGMFSLAIYDRQTGEIVLTRDRYGIKPLYYAVLADRLVFASEMKALVVDSAVPRELDDEAIDLYLTFGYIPAPWTIYRHVRMLMPGHDALWDGNMLSIRQWYDLAKHRLEPPPDFEAAKDELRARLSRAVKRRMISDVPLGAFLSGGIDSSTVVGLMSEHTSSPVKTFSIGFTEKIYDETRYARIVANRFGTEHREFRVSEQDILDVVPTVLDHLDQPFADSSALPTFLVSKYAREHVAVALAGDAADEAFAGYRKYQGEYFAALYRRIPSVLRRGVIEPIAKSLPETQTSRFGEYVRRMNRFFASSGATAIDRHFDWMNLCPGSTRTTLTGRSDRGIRGRELVTAIDNRSGVDNLNAVLFGDMHLCLPNDMFAKIDLMSMYHALEVREPFTDPEVIEFAASLPAHWKLNRTRRKHVLVESVRDLLPPEILKRGKQGFVVPISRWLTGGLASIFWDTVSDSSVRDLGVVDINGVRKLYNEHRNHEADHTVRLWLVFVLHWWHQRSHQSN